jgi:hypothetical protein
MPIAPAAHSTKSIPPRRLARPALVVAILTVLLACAPPAHADAGDGRPDHSVGALQCYSIAGTRYLSSFPRNVGTYRQANSEFIDPVTLASVKYSSQMIYYRTVITWKDAYGRTWTLRGNWLKAENGYFTAHFFRQQDNGTWLDSAYGEHWGTTSAESVVKPSWRGYYHTWGEFYWGPVYYWNTNTIAYSSSSHVHYAGPVYCA